MEMLKTSLKFLSFVLLLSGFISIGHAEEARPATLQVMILDENGSLLHTAHVYIFSQNKKKFFGMRDAYGTTNFDLPAGDYRVYAALTMSNQGIIDHYASPEAQVRLTAEEPTSIILPLQKAEDSEFDLNDTARKKLGIDEELANNLN
jgi:hypothetical protein